MLPPLRRLMLLARRTALALGLAHAFTPIQGRAEDAPAPQAPAGETRAAEASQPPCVFERYVSVAAEAGFDPRLAEEVRKDLAVELAPRGFGVCPSRVPQGELVAEVALVQREPALVAIQVEDYTTGKRVARDVRLGRIPAGGVALAIAIAADELLRASWAELMLRRARAAEMAAADAARSQPEQAAAQPSDEATEGAGQARAPAPLVAIGLAFDYAHTLKAWDGLGFDLRLQLRPFRYGFFELGAGGAFALPVKGELGTAHASGVQGLVTAGACGQPGGRVSLCAGARGTLQWTRFRGEDARAAAARDADLTSFVLSALGQLQIALAAHLFVFSELSLGAALVGARVTDSSGTLVGLEGFVFGAALGMGYAL